MSTSPSDVPSDVPSTGPSDGAELLAEPMRSRWSPTVFDAHHVLSDVDVVTLLQAARWAPSWGNRQPCSFVVAPRGSRAHDAVVATLSRGNSGWVPRASLVVVGAVPPDAAYDLGQALAHLSLQAQAMGLHSHQFAGFDRDALAAALGAPSDVGLAVGVAVGLRAVGEDPDVLARDREREQRVRERRPLEELTHTHEWGRAWVPGEATSGADGAGLTDSTP